MFGNHSCNINSNDAMIRFIIALIAAIL